MTMTATQAAMIMMSGSADLEDITIIENGEYESVDHDGFGVVTVEVPTMVECAEEVAEILGVDTSQEWDCDDIKTKAQEVVDENEEMQECCDEVLDVIHDYDPTYDPHPVPPDPTNPTIPEKIQEIIDEESGYTFPEGTPIDPILELVGGDRVTDEDADIYIRWGFQTIARDGSHLRPLKLDRLSYTLSSSDGPDGQGYIGFRVLFRVYQTDGTLIDEHGLPFEYTGIVGDVISITDRTIDYTTGRVTFKGRQNGTVVERGNFDYTIRELVGYGDPSHTKKVKNS